MCKLVENEEACVCCHEQVDACERIICEENCNVNMDGFSQLCLQPLVLENILIGLHHTEGKSTAWVLEIETSFQHVLHGKLEKDS